MFIRNTRFFFGTALALFLLASEAEAHWCNDLWNSAYNLVVRPESDTLTVPTSGSAMLTIFVQNNMEYALPNFVLVADIGGTAIPATRRTQKIGNTLLPGEKAKYELTVSKNGGGTVNATDINFSVTFGETSMSQWDMYGEHVSGAKAAMIKKTDGSLFPSPVPALDTVPGGNGAQGAQLFYAAVADFGDTNGGLDKLLKLYCAGRASWNSGSAAVVSSKCPDSSTTVCPTTTPPDGPGSKFDYMHLWAAGELAARKSALGARTAVFRQRLQCAVNDPNTGFAGFALMMLGYLGEDAGARTFIEGKIAGTGELSTIGKAAIVLMRKAEDLSAYRSDITAGASSSSTFIKASCAAALGIVERDDAIVENNLIPLAQWIEPDTGDNGQAIYAAQILNIVAWDRRGWAPGAGDTGTVSFYGENASGGGGAPGTGGMIGTGGAVGTGGVVGTGGEIGTGGAMGTGGTPGAGGAIGTGGSQNSGGRLGTGGILGVGGSMGGTTGNKDAGPTIDAPLANGGNIGTGGVIAIGGTIGSSDASIISGKGGATGDASIGPINTGGMQGTGGWGIDALSGLGGAGVIIVETDGGTLPVSDAPLPQTAGHHGLYEKPSCAIGKTPQRSSAIAALLTLGLLGFCMRRRKKQR